MESEARVSEYEIPDEHEEPECADVLAMPIGSVHRTYNHVDTPIVTITLRDTSNVANQLGRTFKVSDLH